MPDIFVDADVDVIVPVNILPLLDSTDFVSIETAVVYNSAGLALTWNFVTAAGVVTGNAITPTTGGAFDWSEPIADKGMYAIELPASGQAAGTNNDREGVGWFTGVATGVLPWRGPTIGFRRAALNDLFMDGGTASTNLEDFFDGTGYAGGTAKLTVNTVQVNGTSQTAGDVPALVTTVDTVVDAILVDTGTTLEVDLDAIIAAVITNAAGVDIAADIIAVKADTAAILTDTGTTLEADLDAIIAAVITNAAGVDIAADIIAVKAETATILADTNELQVDDYPTSIAAVKADTAAILIDTAVIGALGAGLTAVPWNASWDAEVQSEANDALIANNLDHLALTATAAVDMTTEVADGTIISRIISNSDTSLYVPATSNLTTVGAVTINVHDVDLPAVKTDTAAILVDTGTTLEVDLDAIIAAVITNAAGVDIAADIIAVKADTAAILTDTNELQVDDYPTSIAAVKADTAAVLADTGTDGVVVATASKTGYALSDAGVDALFVRALTEAYAADGAAPTVAQALFAIQQFLQERAVSGTTVTVKKLNGSTTAMTFTLDDGTAPTSITRAT